MIKYKNTTKFRILVSDGKELINFLPDQVLEVNHIIPQLDQFLVLETAPKKLVEESEEEVIQTNNKKLRKRTYRSKED